MAIATEQQQVQLGPYTLDTATRVLRKDGQPVRLSGLPFQVLVYLVEHRDRLVSRAELLEHFWEGRNVYEASLTKAIGAIRRALDDSKEEPQFIETRYGEGYRYIGPCAMRPEGNATDAPIPAPAVDARPAPRPDTRLRASLIAALVVAALLGAGLFLPWRKPSPPRRSLAVLPLKNLSGDPAQEYFSDGLTEHLINTLARIDGLSVIARESSFHAREQSWNPREAGKRLGVDAVLEGSVLKQGDRLRVEVRLLRPEDGRVLWASAPAEHTLSDLFIVQDEIARHVVAGLKGELTPQDEQRLTRRPPENPDAYQARLKGDYYRNQRTPDGLRKAIAAYRQAIALDPGCLPAYLGLAGSYYMGIWYIPLDTREATVEIKAAALTALKIDHRSSEAHLALAGVQLMEWNWEECVREMERAIELDPTFSDYGYAYQLLLYRNRPEDAVRWIQRAERLDPLSTLVSANVAEILYLSRRYDDAIAQCQKTLGLDPNYALAHTHLGLAYLQKGRHDDAIAEFEKAIALSERSPDLVARLALAHAAAGRGPEARRLLAELTALARQRHVPPYRLAEIHAALGDPEQAFFFLEQAYRAHAMHLCNLRVEPTLDPLRPSPRFADLLRRVGLAH